MEAPIQIENNLSLRLDFNQATIKEVQQMVVSTAVCENLDNLRASQGPTHIDNNPILDGRVRTLRGHIEGLMDNDKAMTAIANLPENAELSRDQIANLLGLGQGYELLVTRLYYTINKNIDPEVVPIVVGAHFTERGLPISITDSLANDATLILNLTDLLTDAEFKRQFFLNSWPDAPPFSEEVAKKIEDVKDRWLNNIKKRDDNPETIKNFENTFRSFFNFDRKKWAQDGDTLYNTHMFLQGATNTKYFERRWSDSVGVMGNWTVAGYSGSMNNLDYIKQKAIAIERGKYLVSLFKITDKLYQEYFPEIYEKPDVEKLTMEDPDKRWLSQKVESCDQANGHWKRDGKEIGVKSGTIIRATTASQIAEEEAFHFGGPKAKRKVVELSTLAHEETHAIYEKMVRKDTPRPDDYNTTADHAINEGVSVLMEILMNDKLVQNAAELGFSEEDVRKFKEIKSARFKSLRENQNGYTEGTFRIIYRIYAESAYSDGLENVHNGLVAVKDFLLNINPKKTIGIKRDSPEYVAALKSGNPEDWKALFY